MNRSPKVREGLDRVAQIAESEGLAFKDETTRLVIPYDMGAGRLQVVYIQCEPMDDGGIVVSFLSPCFENKPGFFTGLSKDQALSLLRRNHRMIGAAFILLTARDGEFLAVRAGQLLDTMQLEEFRRHLSTVCSAADAYEREIGQDDF